jgi:hypothetical protein
MAEANDGNPAQFLDLLLDYFADGVRWTQGDLDDGHGRRCLVGAIHYLRRKHQIPSGTPESLLQEALRRPGCPSKGRLTGSLHGRCSGTSPMYSTARFVSVVSGRRAAEVVSCSRRKMTDNDGILTGG